MGNPCGIISLIGIHRNGYLDFRGADHEHVDSDIRQSFEELGGHSGMGAHSDSHNGNLGNVGTLSKLAASTFLQVLPESFFSPKRILRRNRKSQVGLSIASYVLNDHIDHNTSGCHNLKHRSGGTRSVRQFIDAHSDLVLVYGHATNQRVL